MTFRIDHPLYGNCGHEHETILEARACADRCKNRTIGKMQPYDWYPVRIDEQGNAWDVSDDELSQYWGEQR